MSFLIIIAAYLLSWFGVGYVFKHGHPISKMIVLVGYASVCFLLAKVNADESRGLMYVYCAVGAFMTMGFIYELNKFLSTKVKQ